MSNQVNPLIGESSSDYQDILAGVEPSSDLYKRTHVSFVTKKSNHQVNVVRIEEVLPHPDPDTLNLELIKVGDYQVVVRKRGFKAGDLAVYIQPDSVVPQTEPFRFIWEKYVEADGTVPEKRRRITVRKLRGQWSEGLLLPLSDFFTIDADASLIGTDVSDLLGITHYDPDTAVGTASIKGLSGYAPKKKFRYPRTFMGWIHFLIRRFIRRDVNATRDVPFDIKTYDVEAYKNHKDAFLGGEEVVVTEKIHGSNARFIAIDGVVYAGSRNQWKAEGGNDVWNRALKEIPWIKTWLLAHEGYALYGEVTPTQPKFNYGSKDVQFFVFDILGPDQRWLDYSDYQLKLYSKIELDNLPNTVPELYRGPFDADKIAKLVDGPSVVDGATNIREGIVVKAERERRHFRLDRVQLKLVSNDFLAKDSKN